MIFRILVIVIIFSFSFSINASTLSKEEKFIGRCVGVLAFSTNYALLHNNLGQAKLLISQTAKANVAMILSFQENSTIPKWKLTAIDRYTGDLSSYYNNNSKLLFSEVDACIAKTNSILTLNVYQTKRIDNRSIQELIDLIHYKLSKQLGI